MKLAIAYTFMEGPYGGGNQFLKALRNQLAQQNSYTPDIKQASALLANANPGSLSRLLRQLTAFKQQHPRKPIIVRIDGPTSLVRGKGAHIDQLTAKMIDLHADGLIYQSDWSKNKNREMFNTHAPYQTTIHNAVNQKIFHPSATNPANPSNKIQLIASSWSSNMRKGFDIYKHLDQHLDWTRYAMTFVGNSPIPFRNINILPPVPSAELAQLLRQHHLYITASKNDPCSNALLEALACGLPAIVRNSGGHPELVANSGILFNDAEDVINAIDTAASQRPSLQVKIPSFSITAAAQKYITFTNHIRHDIQNGSYDSKSRSLWKSNLLRLKHAGKILTQ